MEVIITDIEKVGAIVYSAIVTLIVLHQVILSYKSKTKSHEYFSKSMEVD